MEQITRDRSFNKFPREDWDEVEWFATISDPDTFTSF
jgi:hypothetical protein